MEVLSPRASDCDQRGLGEPAAVPRASPSLWGARAWRGCQESSLSATVLTAPESRKGGHSRRTTGVSLEKGSRATLLWSVWQLKLDGWSRAAAVDVASQASSAGTQQNLVYGGVWLQAGCPPSPEGPAGCRRLRPPRASRCEALGKTHPGLEGTGGKAPPEPYLKHAGQTQLAGRPPHVAKPAAVRLHHCDCAKNHGTGHGNRDPHGT